MKVLFVSPTGTLDNGAEVSIVNLMALLSKRGHQVFNVFPRTTNSTVDAYLDFLEQAQVKPIPLETYQWWWEDAPSVANFDSELTKIYYYRNVKAIRKIIREEKIDLVISNTANVFLGAIAAACEGVQHFWMIHEFPYGEFAYYKDKLPFMVAHSNKIFAVEGRLAQELSSVVPKDKLGTFVPYSELPTINIAESLEHRIVSIGKLTERKNQLELLRAYEQLSRPDIPLVFIGGWDEEYKDKCDQFIQEKSLSNIHFWGHMSSPWTQVKSKDIIAFSSSLETFSLVLIESLITGQPVVFSDNPGHRTVSNKFNIDGCDYELGQVDQLVALLEERLNTYDSYHQESQILAHQIKLAYNLESSYTSILDALEKESNPTTLTPISPLFDIDISDQALPYLQRQRVKIYFANQDGQFREDKTLVFPFKDQDKFSFTSQDTARIRIDLSELPALYTFLTLVSEKTNQVFMPVLTNGVLHENGYLFIDQDPQLIYDVPIGEPLIFTYQKAPQGHLITPLLHYREAEQERVFRNELEQLKSQLEESRKSYEQVNRDYHAVIGSRRWIIPTKIINFFRRNK